MDFVYIFMLECYITQDWKGLLEANTLTYWGHL
jgi:hypothetical protein